MMHEQWEYNRLREVMKALTGITWNYDRSDIPNRAGYRFLALLRDGTHWWCQVVRHEDGGFTILNGLFPEIVAWRENQWEGNKLIRVDGGTTDNLPIKPNMWTGVIDEDVWVKHHPQ